MADETFTVASAEALKTGTGARGKWTLWKLALEGDPQEPTGFEFVKAGDQVTVTQETVEKDGETFVNLKYKKVKGGSSSAAAPTSSSPAATAPTQQAGDARVVKLLVLIADQVGVPKNEVLDVLG